jgi:ribose transport system ATP-binding protein
VADTGPLLQTQALCKSFAVPVLRAVDFSLAAGEIHALLGSNGAGKSTLCNLIAGVLQADSGHMRLHGAPYCPNSIRAAEARGVRMVMQELNLFPTLSIAENLCFQQLSSGAGLIRPAELHARARAALQTLELDALDPRTPVAALGVGQQQLIEIARVLAQPLSLLILDEPTAALTDPQIEILFARLRELRARGAGIIYISHRMDEISRIADRVSVLRDGQLLATAEARSMDSARVVHLMAGPALAPDAGAIQAPASAARSPQPALRLEGFGRRGAFTGIDLELYPGEVLGIGGLIGSGRSELLRALFGADRADHGCLRLASDGFRKAYRFDSPSQAVAAGIGLVVEDRKAQGLLLAASVRENLSLGQLSQLSNRLGLMDRRRESELAKTQCAALDIQCQHLEQPVRELSGGNQQKVLMGRWLALDLPILLFDEPSRGVDARAKARIGAQIRALAAAGKAVLVVSSETAELRSLADRIAVLSNGRLAETLAAAEASEARLLEASFRYYARSPQLGPPTHADEIPA